MYYHLGINACRCSGSLFATACMLHAFCGHKTQCMSVNCLHGCLLLALSQHSRVLLVLAEKTAFYSLLCIYMCFDDSGSTTVLLTIQLQACTRHAEASLVPAIDVVATIRKWWSIRTLSSTGSDAMPANGLWGHKFGCSRMQKGLLMTQ